MKNKIKKLTMLRRGCKKIRSKTLKNCQYPRVILSIQNKILSNIQLQKFNLWNVPLKCFFNLKNALWEEIKPNIINHTSMMSVIKICTKMSLGISHGLSCLTFFRSSIVLKFDIIRPVLLGLFADDDSSQSRNVRVCHWLCHCLGLTCLRHRL